MHIFTILLSASSDIGENLGDLLASWAGALFSGIAGVMALVFLINRRFTDLAVFLLAVVLVGGLVFAPGTVQSAVTGIWETVAGN